MLPKSTSTNFKVHTIFFNIGINEKTKLAEALGNCKDQHRSNWDNFDRLKHYHIRYKKLSLISNHKNQSLNSSTSNHDICSNNVSQTSTPHKVLPKESIDQTVVTLLNEMESLLRANLSKNVKILHIAEDVTRAVSCL
jgi:inositol polyphosphate-4-phosphatase